MSECAVNYSSPEPNPVPNSNPSIHDLVVKDIEDRKRFGLEKYGTLLQAGNGRKGLVDAYQEILDLVVYLRQHIEDFKMPIKLTDAIKSQVENTIAKQPGLTKLAALSMVHAQFESCFESVFNEYNLVDVMEDWNDGESDAEYCEKRFGENFEGLI